MDVTTFRTLALSLPEAVESPHFERTSFRFRKKIFATLAEQEGLACLMLTPEDQDVFVALGKGAVYPVPNKWGAGGATYVRLAEADPKLVEDTLTAAYQKLARPSSNR